MLPTVLNKTFEKDFKLINNITFGETMENLRKRIHVRPINNTADFSQKIFNKNFVAIHEIKPVLTLDKPIYIEFSILHFVLEFLQIINV